MHINYDTMETTRPPSNGVAEWAVRLSWKELDLALFYANNSLRLDSMQPEMRRLRSSFSSEMSDESWEKTLHEKILEREMEYMPPDTLDPAATPDFKSGNAPSEMLPVDPAPVTETSAARPPSDIEIAESLNASLSKGSFGSAAPSGNQNTAGLAQADENRQ